MSGGDNTNNGSGSKGPPSVPSDDKALVTHLSKEITTYSSYLMTFRARMAFTVLIGPFVIFGSVFIALDGHMPERDNLGTMFAVGAWLAVAAYIGLAVYGAQLDKSVMLKCDQWRKTIAQICKDPENAEIDTDAIRYGVTTRQIRASYVGGIIIALVGFLGVAAMAYSMRRPVNGDQAPERSASQSIDGVTNAVIANCPVCGQQLTITPP